MIPRPRRFRVRVGQRWLTVEVRPDPHGRPQVWVEGQPVEVEALPVDAVGDTPPAPALSPAAPPRPRGKGTIVSPLPGRVVAVSAQVGDRVQAGDEVCVIESMKMEQSIRCDQAGVVKAVFVRPGQTVQAGDALVEVEGEGG